MYTVELDLHLRFLPPMSETGRPIILTRTITLPFPAFKGLCIFSKHIDTCPEPEGLGMTDVLWDMDRGVFLATTEMSDHGCSFDDIPAAIHDWTCRGWRWGSHRDRYAQPVSDDAEEADEALTDAGQDDDAPPIPDDLHRVPFRKRPKEFNRAFKAMIRQLAEGFELATAYAMDESGMYFDDPPIGVNQKLPPEVQRFVQLKDEFAKWPETEQFAWRDRVIRYRSLEHLVRKLAARSGTHDPTH